MIYITGLSISLFIAALLLKKKKKSRSDFILLGWILFIAIHLYFFYINFTGDIYKTPHLLGIHFPLPLFHGIFLYYYVLSVTHQFSKQKKLLLVHLIPIIVAYIYLSSFFMLSGQEKIAVFENKGKGYEMFLSVGLVLIYISGIVYMIFSSILLKKYKKNIHSQFSDIEEIDLSWLQFLIYGLGLIWGILIISNKDEYIFIGLSVFVILIGFFGIQQKNIFKKEYTVYKQQQKTNESKKKKYEKSGLTDDLANSSYILLMQLMKKEKCYKENDLSLNSLATKLEIHPNYLSEIINRKEEKSFYDFINDFRIEEFKTLLKNSKNQNYTLLSLAYECGFNSKSSFNRCFKKSTGKTPTQYLKSHRL
ncbi:MULTISPECIES: helix-turn-helix domain-containing protein [Aquimarina]|uniref:helix-turn-helix domain-containing protein n=1 Tax=Aquimarina TaxID=290174 RepID=UPI0009446BC4|nr:MULTISPECIES: AraC family transcriptional regulator [Aquimarina]